MADWVNNGSYQDLSDSAFPPGLNKVSTLAPTSQAGGNMLAWEGNEAAMTAPGSPPVDNMNAHVQQVREDPEISASNADGELRPGTDGKQQASGQAGSPGLPAPSWKRTASPGVKRRPVRLQGMGDANG